MRRAGAKTGQEEWMRIRGGGLRARAGRNGAIPLILAILLVSVACEKKAGTAGGPAPEVLVALVEKKDVSLDSEFIGTTVLKNAAADKARNRYFILGSPSPETEAG